MLYGKSLYSTLHRFDSGWRYLVESSGVSLSSITSLNSNQSHSFISISMYHSGVSFWKSHHSVIFIGVLVVQLQLPFGSVPDVLQENVPGNVLLKSNS